MLRSAPMQGIPLLFVRVFVLAGFISASSAHADEPIVVQSPMQVSFVDRATTTAQDAIDQAMDLLGIPYRRAIGGAAALPRPASTVPVLSAMSSAKVWDWCCRAVPKK